MNKCKHIGDLELLRKVVDYVTSCVIHDKASDDPYSYKSLSKLHLESADTLRKMHYKGCVKITDWVDKCMGANTSREWVDENRRLVELRDRSIRRNWSAMWRNK